MVKHVPHIQKCLADRGLTGFDVVMSHEIRQPVKARSGDKVAVLSPSFAAPGFAPAVHGQAMLRLTEVTGLVPVEYPTTRLLDASQQARADDVNAAFADPEIRAVLATIGGDDQITIIPYLESALVRADPKPFLGYSDNTNLLNWLWNQGVAGFYGGSTQVQLGPGPAVDAVHIAGLRAALLTGERLELSEPGESEDFGRDWNDPAALTRYGDREPTEPWVWAGPARSVTGRTWGGCLEVVQWILTAGRFGFGPSVLEGAVLLVETSEKLIPARECGWILRSLGERGFLAAVGAVIMARPPTSNFEQRPSSQDRAALRAAQRDTVIEVVGRYNPEAVIVVGVPFGHTRPQWILPYGGEVTIDSTEHRVWASYS
jgi:muramoyltetrapeptide carboxypeptidase LdcA involved in peptidoglycan recycling